MAGRESEKGLIFGAIGVFVLVLIFVLNSESDSSRSSGTGNTYTPPKAKEWYEGGNLHKAKIKDWKVATDENKLATCGDFIAADYKIISMPKSYELMKCIDEAVKGQTITDESDVAEIATLCVLLLKESN